MGDRKMKKGIGGVSLLGVVFLGIAGCGSQQPVVEKKEAPPPPEKKKPAAGTTIDSTPELGL